jgi:DNA-binding SARP family transcriptional activator/predicted XRE-type DNA-binding protein
MIFLRALGTAEIDTGTVTLTPSQEIVFAAALYLIVERGKPVSRSRIASLLWPRVAESARAHRLRQTIHQLKKLGIAIDADRDVLRLAENGVQSDIGSFSDKDFPFFEKKGLEFLPGYNPSFSEPFQDWVDAARQREHSTLTQTLLSMLQLARDCGKWTEVERISGHCLSLDAYNEAAVLARAEAYAMRGQKARAVAMLDQYIRELAPRNPALAIPATILRKRVLQHSAQSPASVVSGNEPGFVGRELEMEALTQLLGNARDGRGGGCIIVGEPGIGKTRLCSEIAEFAKLQGVRVEHVGCKRADMHQPLSVFVALVPGLRELPGALGCDQKSLIRLKRLTEFDGSADGLPTGGEESATLYTNLRSAVIDLLDAVSEERCLLVIVEDIQWLDSVSAKLFATILAWASAKKIFFVFNSRQTKSLLTESVTAQQLLVIRLDPLATTEAATLIKTFLATAENTSEPQDFGWLIQAGDGNPFFLQELTKHWLETRQKHEAPPSVAMVLKERISRLSAVALQLLQACAVLGENSNLERLEQVLGHQPHELLAGVQELSAGGMLISASPADASTPALLVKHDLLSIEVFNGLAPVSLAFLHRRCGIVLEREALGTSKSTSLMRSCAFHWHHSGDSERAYSLATQCANHLLEIGLAIDAAKSFEGALAYCSTIDAQLEVLRRVVHALRSAQEWPAVITAIARLRALQHSDSAMEHHDEFEILEFEARRRTEIGTAPLFSRTLNCTYNAELPASHRVKAACDALKLATLLPDLKALQRAYFAVRPLLDDGSVDFRSRLQVEVVYNTMCGDLRRAVGLAKERVSAERREGTPLMVANAFSDLTFVLRRTGPYEEIDTTLREAYEFTLQHKLFAASRDFAERTAAFLFETDREGVETWMQRAVKSYGDTSAVPLTFATQCCFARIALTQNRLSDAEWIVDHEFDWESLRHRRGWLAAALALRIKTRVARQASVSEVTLTVEELRQLYSTIATLGCQDFEIAGLCAGLIYIGDQANAAKYLVDYLCNARRDLTPHLGELTSVCHALDVEPLSHRDVLGTVMNRREAASSSGGAVLQRGGSRS